MVAAHNAEEEANKQRERQATRFRHVFENPARVGSEYGEGFVHYRLNGDPYRVDVDKLNEQLRHTGALRLRHSMKPDEAFGLIFNFDNVVANLPAIQLQAWHKLAEELGKPPPLQLRTEILDVSPERTLLQVLGWAANHKEAQKMSFQLAAITSDILSEQNAPQPGVTEWLNALANFNVPCALITCLDRQTVRRALERMCLHDYFTVMVSAEDDLETLSQRLLGASLKLARPPNMCVFFDAGPRGITAAHNCTMKAVAVQGAFRTYQLQAADVTVSRLCDLTVYNIRRLFANVGDEFMDLRQQSATGPPPPRRRGVGGAVLEPEPEPQC